MHDAPPRERPPVPRPGVVEPAAGVVRPVHHAAPAVGEPVADGPSVHALAQAQLKGSLPSLSRGVAREGLGGLSPPPPHKKIGSIQKIKIFINKDDVKMVMLGISPAPNQIALLKYFPGYAPALFAVPSPIIWRLRSFFYLSDLRERWRCLEAENAEGNEKNDVCYCAGHVLWSHEAPFETESVDEKCKGGIEGSCFVPWAVKLDTSTYAVIIIDDILGDGDKKKLSFVKARKIHHRRCSRRKGEEGDYNRKIRFDKRLAKLFLLQISV